MVTISLAVFLCFALFTISHAQNGGLNLMSQIAGLADDRSPEQQLSGNIEREESTQNQDRVPQSPPPPPPAIQLLAPQSDLAPQGSRLPLNFQHMPNFRPRPPPPQPRNRPICGAMNKVSRFINGVPIKALPNSWVMPIIVLFNPDDDIVNTRLCSGTLIHERFIITAASCMKGIENKKSTIRLGYKTQNISRVYSGEDMEEIIVFLGRNLFIHPEYKTLKYDNGMALTTINDVALIRLEKPTNLMPVCVPYSIPNEYSYPRVDSIMSLYAWGKPSKTADYPEIMMGTRLRVTPMEDCVKSYMHKDYDGRYIFCGKNTKTQTCGYVGDMGAGAYIYDERNVAVLSGVLTMSRYDDTCETSDTFQRVSAHVNWIRSVISSPVS